MTEHLSLVLKICLLVLLYLFFLRVLRAVWAELRGPKKAEQKPVAKGIIDHPITAEGTVKKVKAAAPKKAVKK